MKNAKDCFLEIESGKNSNYTTETALRVAFSVLRLSVPTLSLNASSSDKTIICLIEKMRIEWNKFLKKVHDAGYKGIPESSFESLSKEAQPDHYKKWLMWRKKNKK